MDDIRQKNFSLRQQLWGEWSDLLLRT